MPFIAQCPFCGHRVQAPDKAFGASGRCPRCADFYTVVPAADTVSSSDPEQLFSSSPIGTASLSATAVAPSGPKSDPTVKPASKANQPKPFRPIELPRSASLTHKSITVAGKQEVYSEPRRYDPIVLACFVSGGAALLCALFPALIGLVLPLSLLGMIIGLAGVFALAVRPLNALVGTALAATVFFVALVFPDLLGIAFRNAGSHDAAKSDGIHVVPLTGLSTSEQTNSAEWIDASQAALERGGLRIQILNVSTSFTDTGKGSSDGHLFIRLRVYHFEKSSSPADVSSKSSGGELGRPGLWDNTGKVYGLRTEQTPANSEKSSLSFADVVYDFEPLTTNVSFLRLEIPTKTPGLEPFHFTIPASMFVQQ